MRNDILKYNGLVDSIKSLLKDSRGRIVREVNQTIVFTYWHIGRYIVEYEQGGKDRAEYGKELLKRLSQDLTKSFGKGFSYRNLRKIKQFYITFSKWPTLSAKFGHEKWPTVSAQHQLSKVQEAYSKLSWSHFVRLLRFENITEFKNT